MADLTWISDVLTAGSRDGTGLVPGDLAPEDIIATKVRELLAADASISAAVEDISRWPTLPRWYFRDLPAIYVYTGATDAATAPTRVYREQVDVFVGIAAKLDDITALEDWAPSIPTLARAVRKVLYANRTLADTYASQTVRLARRSQPGPVSWILEETQPGLVVGVQELSWSFDVVVDSDAAQLVGVN